MGASAMTKSLSLEESLKQRIDNVATFSQEHAEDQGACHLSKLLSEYLHEDDESTLDLLEEK